MVKIIPFVAVANARKTFELYKKVFDADEINHSPLTEEVGKGMNLPDDFNYENSTMHMEFKVLGCSIYMSDSVSPNGKSDVHILFEMDSQEQIEKVYKSCVDNGFKIEMKLEKTFWGAHFAYLTDPFGIPWQFNYQHPQEN